VKFMVCRVLLVAALALIPAGAQTLPPIKTVFVIVMENHGWPLIRGSTNAPFINQVLLPQASYCEQYYTPSNFTASLLSYLWLEAGSTFGLTSGNTNCYNPPALWSVNETNHFSTLLNNAGISWKSYQECISGDIVPLTNRLCYAVRHNPFVYFHDVTGTNDPHYPYGIVHNRPYSEFWADLTNHAVAQYNFITPGVCSDMHDSCAPLTNRILQGDSWLAAEVPKILDSTAYRDNGALFILWDDAGLAGIPMGLIVLSPLARGNGYASTNRYTHSDTLRTFQDIFGVRPYLGGAADARNLAELFAEPGSLRFCGIEKLGAASYRLSACGASSNATLVLQVSTNLLDWDPLQTNLAGKSTFEVHGLPNRPGEGSFFRLLDPGN
jgi:hypothetical protein